MNFKLLSAIEKNKIYQYIILILIVLGFFHYTYSLNIIDPTSVSWLFEARHDWGQHYLGWAFYRHEPWTFPLGAIESLCYPAGTNVGYWDSIPLFAIIFKPFSSLLPADFQYIGFFLLLCHLMTALYTYKILRLYNTNFILICLGVILVSFNPVLVYRGLHPALCAHGLIVASIYYYLIPATSSTVKGINKAQIVLALVSALVNPYICAMVIGFNLILPLKHYFYNKLINLPKALFYITASIAGVLLSWFLLGMVSFNDNANLQVSGAYGLYSFNLNSLYNSHGFSSLIPGFKLAKDLQYEGFMYMGAGLMLLSIFAVIYFFKDYKIRVWVNKHRFLSLLLLLAFVTALFAITNKITFNEKTLFEIPIPLFAEKIGGIFRASGRFFWIPFYLIILAVLIIFIKAKINTSVKAAILALIVLLQVYDLNLLYTFRSFSQGSYDSPLDEDKWSEAVAPFERIITYPPFNNHLLNNMDYQDLCYVALKNGKTISTGYSAREDVAANLHYTDSLTNSLYKGQINEKEIYVTTAPNLHVFGKLLRSKNIEVNYLDGYYIFSKPVAAAFNQGPEVAKHIDSVKMEYAKVKFELVENYKESQDKISYHMEKLVKDKSVVLARGWAFLKDKTNNRGDSVFVTVTQGNKTYLAETKQIARPDVTNAFGKEYLENSGFASVVYIDQFKGGDYTIGLAIKDTIGNYTFCTINSDVQ